MTDRPILFSGPMVQAILDGRKTMTRRVITPQPYGKIHFNIDRDWLLHPLAKNGMCYGCIHSKYGKPGDHLWVRESLHRIDGQAYYSADGSPLDCVWKWQRRSLPSIFMPRELSRITLQIVNVRVERVQDISSNDSIAEGVLAEVGNEWVEYANLWNSINAERGFGWDVNPWVWVIEFKKVQA